MIELSDDPVTKRLLMYAKYLQKVAYAYWTICPMTN